jgi:hypothetical protein
MEVPVKRIVVTLLLAAAAISCSEQAARTPLGPSAMVEPNGTGQSTVVSWSQFAAGPRTPVDAVAIVGPGGLVATVSGSTVMLVWQPPPGVVVSQYIVEAGSAPGLSDIALFLTGSTATSLTVGDVPNNTYYVRVRGLVGNTGTEQSNEVVVTVGTAPPPCASTVTPTAINVGSAATTATVTVTSTCAWTAFSGVSWVTIASGASGVGNGVVTLNIAANPGGSRVGLVSIAGQTVTVTQSSGTLSVGFELYDPGTQITPTTECRIAGNPSQCELRSTSFTFGPNAIVNYQWSVQYTYDTVKVLTASGASPIFSFSDICGQPSSTADGVSQPLSATLTITDNFGETATATAGVGTQPALSIRLFTCP